MVRQGYELNVSPQIVQGSIPSFSAVAIEKDNIVLDTMKPAEDGSKDMILRLYESKKAAVRTKLSCSFGISKAYACDMLENVQMEIPAEDGSMELAFGAFEVKTIRIRR